MEQHAYNGDLLLMLKITMPLFHSIYFTSTNKDWLIELLVTRPLEEHVSRWAFMLEARDSKGLAVNDTLELSVQHHKGRRTVTHAYTLDLAVHETPTPIEWQITLVDRLAALYGDSDAAHITVLGVTPQDDPVTFTWTNDSLPRNHCPREQIDSLLKVNTFSCSLSSCTKTFLFYIVNNL